VPTEWGQPDGSGPHFVIELARRVGVRRDHVVVIMFRYVILTVLGSCCRIWPLSWSRTSSG
jgi:hypothetical protein